MNAKNMLPFSPNKLVEKENSKASVIHAIALRLLRAPNCDALSRTKPKARSG